MRGRGVVMAGSLLHVFFFFCWWEVNSEEESTYISHTEVFLWHFLQRKLRFIRGRQEEVRDSRDKKGRRVGMMLV
jgi:hypothetical protein